MENEKFDGNAARIAYFFLRTDLQCYYAVYDFGNYLYEQECSADEVDFSKCREYTREDYLNQIH